MSIQLSRTLHSAITFLHEDINGIKLNKYLHVLFQILNILRVIKYKKLDGRGLQHEWGEERCIELFGGEVEAKDVTLETNAQMEKWNNIKIDIKMWDGGMDWIDVAQDADR